MGTINAAEVFGSLPQICASTQFSLGALWTIPSTSWLGFCSDMHGQLWDLIQWAIKVFSQPPIEQVLPLKKMREACNFHHRYLPHLYLPQVDSYQVVETSQG